MSVELEQWHRDSAGFAARVQEPLYNRLPFDRLPDRLVRPKNEEEVARAVVAARAARSLVSVRSGGCSWIGASLRTQGTLIDIGALDHVRIDPQARRAWVGPAVRGRDFGHTLARHGLAFPLPHCGSPALGGYLLAGGLGFNWGTWQPACFSIRSIRAVTSSGERVVADESTNSELLWMARGAGPAFPGVVTEFELALRERPADTRVSSWSFPLDALDEVTQWLTTASAELGADIEIALETIGPERPERPPVAGLPAQLVNVAAIAYSGSERQAREALRPLSDAPPALAHGELQALPFESLHLGADAAHPEGHRVLGDTFWSDHDVHALMAPLPDTLKRSPSGKNAVVALMPAHGAPRAGVPMDAGAYSMDARTLVLAFATWTDPATDAANRRWLDDVVALLEPASNGHFLAEADLVRHPHRAERSFGAAQWARLQALRRRWDPDGLFGGFGTGWGG